MSDKENVLILDRISDFNSVISFYEETAELITKLRPNITMTELKDEFESLSQYEKIVFAARAMVVSESLKLFNIEEILSKYRIGNVELERMFEGIDFLDKFQLKNSNDKKQKIRQLRNCLAHAMYEIKIVNDSKIYIHINNGYISGDIEINEFIELIKSYENVFDKFIEKKLEKLGVLYFDEKKLDEKTEKLSINKFVNSISFEVKSGEILGIAGLMGAGRSELAKTIYGHYPIVSGTMIKKDMKLNKYLQMNLKSSVDGIKNRIAYVSEDRKGDGLILDLSIRENMTLSSLERISNSFIIDKNKEKERVNSYIDRIRIKTPSIEQLIKNLSGGNQQKVAIAKALMIHPDVLILDEPTRGVDVGAKKEIYDLINEFKAQGKAIIMISSEMPELLGLSDRVLVLSHGQITGEFDIKDATQEKILKCAVNIKEDNRDVISGKTTA